MVKPVARLAPSGQEQGFTVPMSFEAHKSKNTKWVFIGAGHLNAIAPLLKSHFISYAATGMIIGPMHGTRDFQKFYPDSFNPKSDWTGIAVDEPHFSAARALLEKSIKPSDWVRKEFPGKPEIMAPAPSDDEMIGHFKAFRVTYERLVQMLIEDKKLTSVSPDQTDPANPSSAGVTAARIVKYRQLLEQVGAHEGCQRWFGGYKVHHWDFGSLMGEARMKGYIYLTKPPRKSRRSLDSFDPTGNDTEDAYRHISGNWYLVYEFIP